VFQIQLDVVLRKQMLFLRVAIQKNLLIC